MENVATLTENTLTLTQEVDNLFQLQKKHAQTLKNTTARERIATLNRFKDYMMSHLEELHEAMYKDFKKSPTEINLSEVFPILASIKHINAKLHRWMRPKSASTPMNMLGTSSQVLPEPKGVCLIIAPWNYPYNLTFDPLMYAIAAGNTAILKPSEMTPHTSAFIKKTVQAVFKPEEVFVFEGDAQVATELLKKPFDHIFFTGSPMLGKIVMKAAAEHLTSVTLELGGKSPVVIDETSNIKDAAQKITYGKFLNCGQTCIAPDYLLVHEKVKDELINEIKSNIKKYYSGEKGDLSVEQTPDYTRIVNQRHFGRVKNLLEDALSKGAKVVAGGETNANDNFIAPTLITDVNDDMNVMKEEIFGPLLPIKTFNHLQEATDYIKTKEKPLALYIFSKDKSKRDFVMQNTTAGGTSINDTLLHIANPDLPFGGVNNSGIGKTHGYFGFQAFSNERAVLKQRIGLTSVKFLYPPYTPQVKKMLKFFMK